MNRLVRLSAVALISGAALSACAPDQDVTDVVAPDLTLSNAGDEENLPHEVTVCKVGPLGTDATFSVDPDPDGVGTLLAGNSVTVAASTLTDPSCVTVWRSVATADPTVLMTVAETEMTPGTKIDQIIVFSNNPATIGTNSVAVDVNFSSGALIIFKNIPDDVPPPPPPPPSGEGCTPGYWKARPHHDDWAATGYSTGQTFASAFGVDAFPGMSLLQVLGQGGGDLIALGRHAVAGLLSSAHPSIDYGIFPADVIAMFQNAYASGDYEATKDILAAANEQDCSFD